jgi:hypothetical protein
MKKVRAVLAVSVLALLACATASQAAYSVIIESRLGTAVTSGGTQNPLFTYSGLATTTVKSTAPGIVGKGAPSTSTAHTGNYYAGDTAPAKWGEWAYNPLAGKGGYYNVYATWATNSFAAGVAAPTWTVNNAGAAVSTALSQATGANAWNQIGSGLLFNAGTTYKTRLTTAATGLSGKRTYFDSVKWEALDPTAASGLIANLNGTTANLSWTSGQYNYAVDLYVNDGTGYTKVASGLDGTVTSYALGSLTAGTTYTWQVHSWNAGTEVTSAEGTFQTQSAVPEPGTIVAALSLLSPAAIMFRRKRS